jgi:WhiB family redox-sensing transcriptional regulator
MTTNPAPNPDTSGPVQLGADILINELLDAHEGWMSLGECRQYNGDDWFPERSDLRPMAGAKRICAGCEVREQCLSYALERNEPWGVWGGLSTPQRKRLLKARRDAVASGSEGDTSRRAS